MIIKRDDCTIHEFLGQLSQEKARLINEKPTLIAAYGQVVYDADTMHCEDAKESRDQINNNERDQQRLNNFVSELEAISARYGIGMFTNE